jgi:hypothetical protein
MELSPIVGIRFTPMIRSVSANMEASPIFDIDELAKIESEGYWAKKEESRGGMQNSSDDLGEDEEDEFNELLGTLSARRERGRHLNYVV